MGSRFLWSHLRSASVLKQGSLLRQSATTTLAQDFPDAVRILDWTVCLVVYCYKIWYFDKFVFGGPGLFALVLFVRPVLLFAFCAWLSSPLHGLGMRNRMDSIEQCIALEAKYFTTRQLISQIAACSVRGFIWSGCSKFDLFIVWCGIYATNINVKRRIYCTRIEMNEGECSRSAAPRQSTAPGIRMIQNCRVFLWHWAQHLSYVSSLPPGRLWLLGLLVVSWFRFALANY